jgi:hypothetical protein
MEQNIKMSQESMKITVLGQIRLFSDESDNENELKKINIYLNN